jgi:SMC interacting uncharacterized protein involved in chromosome segregation
VSSITKRVETVIQEAGNNKKVLDDFKVGVERALHTFRSEVEKNQADVKAVLKLNSAFQAQMDEMNAKLEDFPVIKDELYRQKTAVDAVVAKADDLASGLNTFKSTTQESFRDLETRSNDFQNKLKELRTYVGSLADEIVISSNQVTVATGAGFGNKPMTLFEVLRGVNGSLDGLKKDSKDQLSMITENSQLIATKADDSVLMDVAEMNSKIGTIEDYIAKDEAEGLSVSFCQPATRKWICLLSTKWN